MQYRVTKRTFINGHLVKQTSTQRGQANNLNRKVKPATLVKYDESAHILRATQAALELPVSQLPPAKPKTRPAADFKREVKELYHPPKTEAQVVAMIRRYAELCRPDQQLLQQILKVEIERELTRFPHLQESFKFARAEVVK